MSFKLPKSLSQPGSVDSAASVLDVEILAERAASLGNAGLLVETTLGKLKAVDHADPRRQGILQRAADAVHSYFIQRELSGFSDHTNAIKDYAIPNEVLLLVGVKDNS